MSISGCDFNCAQYNFAHSKDINIVKEIVFIDISKFLILNHIS
jgi:hypothetical protein